MLLYYRARSADGVRVNGSIVARNQTMALRTLQARGYFVTSLDAQATLRGLAAHLALLLRRNSMARLAAFRSLAALIEAGVPLRRALETVGSPRSNGTIDRCLRDIAAEVEAGTSLSLAMEHHPHEFSAVSIAIVRAGEAGGSLDEALRTVAGWEERDRALRQRLMAAMTYPAIVTAGAGTLLLYLIANTVPAFAATFTEMHVPLPAITRLLLKAAQALDSPLFLPFVCASVLMGAVTALYLRSRNVAASPILDMLRLRMPLIGPVLAKAAAARLARTLGSLLHAGVDVVASIDMCAGIVGAAHRVCLQSVTASLRRGEGIVRPFEESALFDPAFVQLVRAGEESGALDEMLLRSARFYESDVEASLVALTGALEPLLICTVGLAVGTIVASILIPLYSMIGNIQ